MNSNEYKVKRHTCEMKYPLLRKYFNAYTIVVSNYFPRFFYIDGFAGTGKCREEHYGKEVDGSPLIALQLKYPFTDYIFIELNPKRKALLEKHVCKYRGKEALCHEKERRDGRMKISIRAIEADINDSIRDVLSKIPQNMPCFIFLDPEGLELKWETVEECSKKPRAELLINFSISGVIRNLKNPRADKTIRDFLGNEAESVLPLVLLETYKEKLEKHFKWVIHKAVLSPTRSTIYYLIFATNNRTGCRIMSNVMKTGKQEKLFNA